MKTLSSRILSNRSKGRKRSRADLERPDSVDEIDVSNQDYSEKGVDFAGFATTIVSPRGLFFWVYSLVDLYYIQTDIKKKN